MNCKLSLCLSNLLRHGARSSLGALHLGPYRLDFCGLKRRGGRLHALGNAASWSINSEHSRSQGGKHKPYQQDVAPKDLGNYGARGPSRAPQDGTHLGRRLHGAGALSQVAKWRIQGVARVADAKGCRATARPPTARAIGPAAIKQLECRQQILMKDLDRPKLDLRYG